MNKLFNSIKLSRPKSNVFDLGHERKLSTNFGKLTPIMLQEVVPGDKFRVNTELLLRLAPMIAPVMHRVNVYTHYFFVPNRLVWSEWEKFITGGESGTDAPVSPYYEMTAANGAWMRKGSLGDHFGLPPIPTGVGPYNPMRISALPFKAYQLIYNEYYRDQNLEGKVPISLTSGDQSAFVEEEMLLRMRAWEKDYFTSALPWAQRGGDVTLPVGGQVNFVPDYATNSKVISYDGSYRSGNLSGEGGSTGALIINSTPPVYGRIENLKNKSYDLVNPDLTVNELRRATKLQQWLERNALGGSRYIEQIFSHFGVKSSDSRLQRPEYLGGGKQPVTISEVLQTSQTDTTPQGNMSGHGISVGTTNQFSKSFEEHGFIIGIMSILPRTAYQQGVPRMFTRTTKLDYYWPEFAHLGEQEVKNKELYHKFDQAGGDDNETTFGYQSRYSEYKFGNSTVHGEFRDTLSFWHMGRIFSARPALNSSLIKYNPNYRNFAVTDTNVDHVYVQLYNDVKAIRPMPLFGTPSL